MKLFQRCVNVCKTIYKLLFKTLIDKHIYNNCMITAYLILIFQWLKDDFLGFLQEWKEQCLSTPNMKKQEQLKMFLSIQTHTGIEITGK